MTVKKRPRPDDDNGVLDIPPALLEELEAMNARMGVSDPPTDGEAYVQVSEPGQDLPEVPEHMYPEDAQPLPESSSEYRLEILGEAAHIVTRDRNAAYGEPEDSFQKIADLWTAYLNIDREILPTDVANMMVLLKIARLAANPVHRDSWVDMAGYAACGAASAKRLLDEYEAEQ